MTIKFAEEDLLLLAEKAIYWGNSSALFIADPHFGKDASLRAQAIPLPDILSGELERIGKLLDETGATSLFILGDLYHDESSITDNQTALIESFTQTHPSVDFVLIRGNHDLRSGDPHLSTRIRCVDPPHILGPFTLIHEPENASEEGFYLAGHLHPGIRLRANRKESASLPAFSISDRLIVLPAFGRLTGQGGLKTDGSDRIVAIADDELIDLSKLSQL